MKYFLSLLFVMALVITSCDMDGRYIQSYSEFPKEKKLYADSVQTQALYDHVFLTLSDSLFAVSSFQADTMLHIYSVPKLNLLCSGAIRGHSASEFSSFPSFCESNGKKLYVRGHTPNIIREYSILNQQLDIEKEYKLLLSSVPNDIHLFDDSIVYYVDFETHTIHKYNLNTRNEILSSWIRKGIKNDSKNIDEEFGSFAANPTTAIFAYQYKKEIEVYNTEDLSPNFCIKWDYENQQNSIHSKDIQDVTLHYTGAVATEDFFYLLYRGYTPNDKSTTSSIEVYGLTGEPLIRYHLNKKLFSFAVDEGNGFFYGFGPNDDYIYRFCFKSSPKNLN